MKCSGNSSYEYSHFLRLQQAIVSSEDPCSLSGSGNESTAFCHNNAANKSSVIGVGGAMTPYSVAEVYLYSAVIPLICLFGIVGNSINLVALASIIRNKPMDRMERSATVGLLALAVSDLLFCITVMPLAFVDSVDMDDRLTFALIYHVYHPAIISTLITSSTWLTVVMALSRYIAICHPLKARIIIGMRFAAGSVVVAFLFSVLLNIPRFLHMAVACVENSAIIRYFPVPGPLQRHSAVDQTYYVLYLVVGILLPLAILAYSNFFLIRAIRHSRRMRSQFLRRRREDYFDADHEHRRRHQQQSQSDTTNAITLTLTIIVIMYAVLVSPAEISNIFTQMINAYLEQQQQQQQQRQRQATSEDLEVRSEEEQQQAVHPDSYNIAVAVGNTLQTLNFACNFVLYCAVNVHFRCIVRQMATCRPWWRWVPATSAARPTVTAVSTFAGHSHPRTTHVAVLLEPKSSRWLQSQITPDRSHFSASDIED